MFMLHRNMILLVGSILASIFASSAAFVDDVRSSSEASKSNRPHNTRHHSVLLPNGSVVHNLSLPPLAQSPPPQQPPVFDLTNLTAAHRNVIQKRHPPAAALPAASAVKQPPPAQRPKPQEYQTSRPPQLTDDLLSRNISFLLENLLKRYEKAHLPTHGQGVPTLVKTNMVIRSMGPVSELDMDYSMDCYFRQHWRDTRLKFRGPMQTLSLSIKMLERIWRPDTYFYNGKHSHLHTITVPNKLLRLTQDGDILYSMRLTIKASCPMELRNFPMDRQSCPLILGSYAYTSKSLVYEWEGSDSVTFVPGMTLSQFDLISIPQRNFTLTRREGDFSVLQVSFNMQRLSGYFLIQVYVPCILIVVLSWVSFWIHREATSDRVGLGITTVLTLSTISLDSRTDLPKVRYATALDWFLLMSFFYCIATLLEFAGVHFFTKVGSGEIPPTLADYDDYDDDLDAAGANDRNHRYQLGNNALATTTTPPHVEQPLAADDGDAGDWEDMADGGADDDDDDDAMTDNELMSGGDVIGGGEGGGVGEVEPPAEQSTIMTKMLRGGFNRDALICPLYGDPGKFHPNPMTSAADEATTTMSAASSRMSTMERMTQTEAPRQTRWKQIWMCVLGDEKFRRQRQREASEKCTGRARYINSVSLIDRTARVGFPMSFGILNILYWLVYVAFQEDFPVPGQ